MTKRLFSLFLSLSVSLIALAQQTGTITSRDAMLYETSSHLFEKGNMLTVVSLDMEWPKGLNGSVLPELQRYLTSFFFSHPSGSYEAGWLQFKSTHGTEVRTIKEDTAAGRLYYDMGLRCLWLEPGRYISFLARLEERSETSIIASKHSYFTFDLIHNKVLTQKDVFNQTRLWQDADIRYQFCELLDETANANPQDSVDWDKLPGQFALKGRHTLFDLGTDPAGDIYSELENDAIDILFSKSFKKWQKQSLPVAVTEKLPNEAVYTALPSDSLFPEVLPKFEGNIAAAIGRNLSYAELSHETLPPGRTFVSFIVETDGTLRDIVFLTVNNIGLNRAIASTLQLSNGWTPATKDGKPVACRYNLPLILHFQ